MRKHIAATCFAFATFASVSGYADSNELFTSEDKARSDINQCDSILENAAHDISMALSYDETKKYLHDQSCGSEWGSLSQSKQTSLGAVFLDVFGLDFGTGSSANNEFHRQWCNDVEAEVHDITYDLEYVKTVNESAIQAWNQCIDAYSYGLQIKHNKSSDAETISFMMLNRTSDMNVQLNGIFMNTAGNDSTDSALNCRVATPSDGTLIASEELRVALPPMQGINVICDREPVSVIRDGQTIEILPSGSITLPNKLKEYMYSFHEESVIKLTDKRADAIEEKIGEIQTNLEKLPAKPHWVYYCRTDRAMVHVEVKDSYVSSYRSSGADDRDTKSVTCTPQYEIAVK